MLKRYFKEKYVNSINNFTHTYGNIKEQLSSGNNNDNDDNNANNANNDNNANNVTHKVIKDKTIILKFINNDSDVFLNLYDTLFVEHILEKINNNGGMVLGFYSQDENLIGLIGGYITKLCVQYNSQDFESMSHQFDTETNFRNYNSLKICLLDNNPDNIMIQYMTTCLYNTLCEFGKVDKRTIDCLYYNYNQYSWYNNHQQPCNLTRELFIRPFNISNLCNSNFFYKQFNTPIKQKVFSTFNYSNSFAKEHDLILLTDTLLDDNLLKILYYNLQVYNKSNFFIYEHLSFSDFKFILKNQLFSSFIVKNKSTNIITSFVCFYRYTYSPVDFLYKYYFGYFDENFDKTDSLELIYKWLYTNNLCDGVIIHDIYSVSVNEYFIMKYMSLKNKQIFYINNINTSVCKSIKNGLLEF